MASGIYVHQLDPFLLEISNGFGIRWYGISYLASFVVGYLTISFMAKRNTIALKPEQVMDFITYLAIGVLAGGRLGYCLFYAPELFIEFDGDFPFWGVLKVNEGGMASHGGIAGVIIICLIYGRSLGVRPLHLLDLTVFGGSIGFFFGRLANFVNGELYGRIAPDTVSWAVKFPQEIYLWYEKNNLSKLKELGPAAEALGKIRSQSGEAIQLTVQTWNEWMSGVGVSQYKIVTTLEQLITATQTGNQKVIEALAEVLNPRYPSQLIQAGVEGLTVFLILCLIWIKPRKPGVISGWYGILYGAGRIIGEQYRMPDSHIGFGLLGLTRGQWLSVGLIVVGLLMLLFSLKRELPALGGWGMVPPEADPKKASKIKS